MEHPCGGSEDFYETEAQSYDDRRWKGAAGKYIDVTQKEIVLSLVGNCEGLKVLDVATGTGRFALELARRGAEVTGLDTSGSMLAVARRKFENEGLTGKLSILEAPATDIPATRGTFDFCLCMNAMNHIPGWAKVLQEMHRVLKPGGTAVTNYTNWASCYLPFGIWVNLRKRSVRRDVYTRWFWPPEILKLHEKVGLDFRELKGFIHFPRKVAVGPLLSAISVFDKMFRNSPLAYLAPQVYVKAEKN